MEATVAKKFFENRDETGRFIVTSSKTGVVYCIEPQGDGRPADWGSYNPSTGNIENKKGFDKHTGSVLPKDTVITEENGFKNIEMIGIGTSPFSEIDRRDEIHYANGRRPKNV